MHRQFPVPLSSEADAREHLERQSARVDVIDWALDDGAGVIGSVTASNLEYRHDTAWMSYWVRASARGSGLATRALATLSDYCFGEGMHRLELGHRVDNSASCTVASRAGYLVEGVERGKLRYGVDRHDVERHARLVTDSRPDVAPLPVQL